MALCIAIEGVIAGGRAAGSVTGRLDAAWSAGEATKTGDQYACPAGSHLLLTIEEVNTPPEFVLDLPALGITPETILIVASMGAALVLGSFFAGWGVGIAKGLIKKM